MTKSDYKIQCLIGGRIVASLSINGELTIYHDHFTDDDGFNIIKFINAFDAWNIKRMVHHASKSGLNQKTLEEINTLQKRKPGKVLLPEKRHNHG